MPIIRTAGDYLPSQGQRASPVTRRDLTFGSAIAEKWKKTPNKLLAVLDVLASGQQGLAGMTRELARRETGHAQTPLLDAFNAGVARSASFSEVTGSPYSGLPFDFVIDPINVIGEAGLIAKGGKLIAKIPGVVRVGEALYEATEASNNIRKAKESLGILFRNKHLLRKRNPSEVIKMLEDYRGDVNFHLHTAGKRVGKKVHDLVPDPEARQKLGVLMDSEPVIKQEGSFEFERWRDAFDTLTPNEKTAYLVARTHFDALEKLKLESGLLTRERIAGFYEKFQRKYVPFRAATKDAVISDINEIKRGVEAGDEDALEILGRFKNGMDDLDNLLDSAERTDDIWLSFRERARKMYREGDMPSWTYRRAKEQTMEEILKETEGLIESDIAKLVHIESREVATAFSGREYSRKLIEWMRDQKLIFPRNFKENEIRIALEANLGKAQAASRMREGFKAVPNVEAIKGYVVPSTIAGEIASVIKRTSDPGNIKKALSLIQKATQFDKAWRLAPFPEFHIRNYFSNKFNMIIGGFNPAKDIKHLNFASRLMWRWMHGEGIYDKAAGRLFGHSEPELYKLALKHRVIGSGETMGELGMLFDEATIHKNIFARWIDPRTSPAIKTGFTLGRWIEDTDRLAYWLSRLDRGIDPREAGRLTNKFLLDYRHGLSGFETEVFRNFLLPFYAWLKMNVMLQIEMLALQPHKYVPFVKGKKFLEDQFGGPDPKMIEEADWIRKNLSVRVGYDKKTGQYKYFIFNSWWPAADLDKIWGSNIGQELLNQMNPWVKVPFELWKNFSLFQGRPIEKYPGEKKKLLGMSLPAKMDYFLRVIRQVNTSDKLVQTLLTKEGVTPNSAKWTALQLFAGKIYPQDPKEQAKWWKYNTDRQIRYLKGQLKSAQRRNDKENIKVIREGIKRLEKLKREQLGITG